MTDVIDQLQQLGFSQYEAQAYIALLRENPLNGYELAKASGIPRPNVYPVLQKLEERGAVLRLDTPDGARYTPVPSDELLTMLNYRYQSTLELAAGQLRQITSLPVREDILNLRGYSVLLDKARTMLENTRQRLLISLWPGEALALASPLQQALDRGVQIVTLCLRGCPQPCPACQGSVFRYPIAPGNGGRWLVLISDDTHLLAGEISSQEDAVAVLTRQAMLVNLSAGYIQNSIALASILSGLGEQLDTLLDENTSAALNSLSPMHAEGQWLEVMRQLLQIYDAHDPKTNATTK